MKKNCNDKILYLIRKDNNMAFYILPVTEARQSFVINNELYDIAEKGLESNQPLFNRREAVEFFEVPIFATDIYIINRIGLRQFSVFQTYTIFPANVDLNIVI